jgi:L-threonylcarbamoyladenylate synthase
MSLLVADVDMAKQFVTDIPSSVLEKLIKPCWPGALTIVLLANKDTVPALVRANGSTVGIRMPDHGQLLEVIKKVGVPLLGPSANFHGGKTPFTMEDLDAQLIKEVDYVMEGKCKGTLASTVIDCTVTPWNILRRGAISL